MNRDEFLRNIAKRLGRPTPAGPPSRDTVGAPAFWQQMTFSPEERLNRFCQSLTQLGAQVHVVTDVDELRLTLRSLLQQLEPDRIGMWNDSELSEWLGDALEPYDVAVWGVHPPATFAEIDIGITGCTYAVADTGTLVIHSGGGKGRSVHLLPSIHLAVVPYSRLCDRLGETLPQLDFSAAVSEEGLPTELTDQSEARKIEHTTPTGETTMVGLPSYVHFVTGPSRSSDIENDHSIGVHGPVSEIVMVVQAL